MVRAVNRLSARAVATVKAPGRHADGAGLYLHVDESGAKRWVFVFQWRKARKEMGLGPLRDVSLAEAREARDSARQQVRKGQNPIEVRRKAKASGRTFGEVARELKDALAPGWKGPKHASQWINTLEQHAAALMDQAVDEIDTDDVLDVLRPIWGVIPETAGRVRGRIEAVLDAAKAGDERTGDNPARWRGHLDKLLPKRPKLTRGHFAALPYTEAPAFMASLRERDGVAARALAFTVLTVAREDMALGATWKEIKGSLWTIPGERMKGGKPHRVPLTAAALAAAGERGADDDLIFPGEKGKLSNMAMDMLLRRMDLKVTVHGFRSTFKDWAEDCSEASNVVIEQALAHVVGDQTERAYRRSDALDKRRVLMEAWATFLGG